MEKEIVINTYPEVFSNLQDYALMKYDKLPPFEYVIIFKPTKGFEILELYYEDAVSLMLEMGVDIYENYDDMMNS
ncbi:hypothetical protein KTO58_21205 [Chitinophaga pendula]|uniref:hypothetical protein n=1 Tax=Chitinophaga TaxID=79328 RepID=UPI000BAEF6F7|nr:MULTISPECIES: hypothetical protein [Chitinophaga]ASZ10851.1 hypothetical protein CK934_07600 [Chitinophaga sp. MD30]UCJ06168.1 hypothetical protein KTO58_21205 [Chitinophaga pendula]